MSTRLIKFTNRILRPFRIKLIRNDLPAWEGAAQKLQDLEFYRPHFEPWRGYGEFKSFCELVRPFSIVSSQNCYVLWSLARQALHLEGDFVECGVYRGGTARLLNRLLCQGPGGKKLHLFDTFAGMPKTDQSKDCHNEGDFADTSETQVRSLMVQPENVHLYKGFIPDTFVGCDGLRIALAHVDLDIFKSIYDTCAFIYPRLAKGGFLVFDDYCYYTCPGARAAVDEFFADKPEIPLVLPNYQAVVVKL